jgi:hypothetical protein
MRQPLSIFALCTLLTAAAGASTGPFPLNCNGQCLEGVMDQYLSAMAAHDPKKAPLSADLPSTENDQHVEAPLPTPRAGRSRLWAPCAKLADQSSPACA